METEMTLMKNGIAFDDIGITDLLLIQTLNSLYKFLVTDPVKHCGVLLGGTFGDCPVRALLCRTSELRTGSHAQFFVGSEDDFVFMKTSTITDLMHVKTDQADQSR